MVRLVEVLKKEGFEKSLIDEITTSGRLKKIDMGTSVIQPGIQTKEIPLVLTGSLKVMRQDKDGKEIFLYYLEEGETCAMSITCCMENKLCEFSALAEEYTELWMIPMNLLNTWVAKYPNFRRFIFHAYQARFDELLTTIDSVAFMKMDERIYKYLLDKKQASGSYQINKTHQQIADELNTSRVVVSRLLKQLEKDGKIEQRRNMIEVL